MAPMMKRFTGLLSRSKSTNLRTNTDADFSNAPTDSPEANAPHAIRLFCESGSNSNGGEEVLHLPVIVESAESSPAAAAGAAQQIRKFLGKEYAAKPHVQYNAIMLIRILSDNPGPTFTRNFDNKFVQAVKELLRNGRDPSTQQILRETLDSLEVDKSPDENLSGLLQMWRKEKGQSASLLHGSRSSRMSQSMANVGFGSVPPTEQGRQTYSMSGTHGQRSGRTQLPSPAELASRVEEAKNTAKILLQLVQSTPTGEVLDNELIKEFSDRCSSASRSMQNYIKCDNPAPDDDTMQTLIETNEQLSLASSRHQRAVLAARRALGANPSPNPSPNPAPAPAPGNNGYSAFAAPGQPPQQQGAPQLPPVGASNGFGSEQPYLNPSTQIQQRSSLESYQAPPGPPPGMANTVQQRSNPDQYQENPFADPVNPEPTHYGAFTQSQSLHRQNPSQSFNIEPEPSFPVRRQNTSDLENAYSDSDGRPSPILSRNSVVEESQRGGASDGFVSPTSPHPMYSSRMSYEGSLSAQAGPAGPTPPRPGPGSWHTNDITPAFTGRQSNAANGLTMHGAQVDANGQWQVQEIDGYSQVGRRERDR